jgi:RimJ/RimL family protein N-acetyltransferase
MNTVLDTPRLRLRELLPTDKAELAQILCEPETMRYYPAPFTEQRVEEWIAWNIDNYRKHNHGLWAVILKEGNRFLGDCGITLQEIEEQRVPEIGYHIKKEFWGNGYATEAAKACIEYGFTRLGYTTLFTYTKHDNRPSIRVAEKNGMTFVRFFDKVVMGETVKEALYRLDRTDP